MATNPNKRLRAFAETGGPASKVARLLPTADNDCNDSSEEVGHMWKSYGTRLDITHDPLATASVVNDDASKPDAVRDIVSALVNHMDTFRLQFAGAISKLSDGERDSAKLMLCNVITSVLDQQSSPPESYLPEGSDPSGAKAIREVSQCPARFRAASAGSTLGILLHSASLLTPYVEEDRKVLQWAVGEEEAQGGWPIGNIVEVLREVAKEKARVSIFSLPREIRDQIYGYLVTNITPSGKPIDEVSHNVWITTHCWQERRPLRTTVRRSVMLTNKKVAEEVKEAFFTRRWFCIKTRSSSVFQPPEIRRLDELSPAYGRIFSRVRKLRVELRYSDWSRECTTDESLSSALGVYYKTVKEIVQASGSLKRLSWISYGKFEKEGVQSPTADEFLNWIDQNGYK